MAERKCDDRLTEREVMELASLIISSAEPSYRREVEARSDIPPELSELIY